MTDKLVCPVCGKEPRISLDQIDLTFQGFVCSSENHLIMIYGKTKEKAKVQWLKAFGGKNEG